MCGLCSATRAWTRLEAAAAGKMTTTTPRWTTRDSSLPLSDEPTFCIGHFRDEVAQQGRSSTHTVPNHELNSLAGCTPRGTPQPPVGPHRPPVCSPRTAIRPRNCLQLALSGHATLELSLPTTQTHAHALRRSRPRQLRSTYIGRAHVEGNVFHGPNVGTAEHTRTPIRQENRLNSTAIARRQCTKRTAQSVPTAPRPEARRPRRRTQRPLNLRRAK